MLETERDRERGRYTLCWRQIEERERERATKREGGKKLRGKSYLTFENKIGYLGDIFN